MGTVTDYEKQGKVLIEQYEAISGQQTRINGSVESLRAQLLENQTVSKELDMLEEDAEIYKSVGPVLVRMDLADAKANVKQRIDRLEKEIVRMGDSFKEKEQEKEKLMVQITDIQNKVREAQQAAAAGEE